jgi:signal transduction histidine kinase
MNVRKRNFLGRFNRFRLILTLGLAVLLPAAALIFVNFSQLKSFERDKVLQAAIHRDFQEILYLSEKRMNAKVYDLVEEVRKDFPSADLEEETIEEKLDLLLTQKPWLTHVMLFNGKDLVFRTQPSQMSDKYVREEHVKAVGSYRDWFQMEGEKIVSDLLKRKGRVDFIGGRVKRKGGEQYMLGPMFTLPGVSEHKVAFGGISIDPCYLKGTFFPKAIEEVMTDQKSEHRYNRLAVMFYSVDQEGSNIKPYIASAGWGDGKPEVTRKLDVFKTLAMGIKYQGTSVEALGQAWVRRSFIILGILSLMIIGGLLLTKRIVGKEMALARLKSDFVSNVSHELRTPLALIRLYAETLELGRISTSEKQHQYYKIIRKESERLTSLINNILDFSRIEAGHKEYEFRETDIAELVHNTLESYRYQIEQQGFTLETSIDPEIPALRVDREAIARALVNLINNALKYSNDDKYLQVKLYRENGSVKLEVADHGIGIARRDQVKIFEKFYRAGDPLVHNTKGSGLGLSLVMHITKAHGGNIAVESTPGRGSKFVLSLPLASAT